MKKYTLQQLISDFYFLYNNISDYATDENGLVNHVTWDLISGKMDIKDFILWSIQDIVNYVYCDTEYEEDVEFLETNKRAIRILERYNIKIQK